MPMPAPKGNQYAKKPASKIRGDSFSVRAPAGTKTKVERAARAAKMKVSTWVLEAIEEKLAR